MKKRIEVNTNKLLDSKIKDKEREKLGEIVTKVNNFIIIYNLLLKFYNKIYINNYIYIYIYIYIFIYWFVFIYYYLINIIKDQKDKSNLETKLEFIRFCVFSEASFLEAQKIQIANMYSEYIQMQVRITTMLHEEWKILSVTASKLPLGTF